jgi:hypothetical protein
MYKSLYKKYNIVLNPYDSVGIGVNDPSYILDINGDVRTNNFICKNDSFIIGKTTENFIQRNKSVAIRVSVGGVLQGSKCIAIGNS